MDVNKDMLQRVPFFFDKKLLGDAIKLAHKSAIKREIMTKKNCY